MWKYYKIQFCTPDSNNDPDDTAIYRWNGEILQVLYHGKFTFGMFDSIEELLKYKDGKFGSKIIAEGEEAYREAMLEIL